MENYYPKGKVANLEGTFEQAGIPVDHPRFKPLLHLYRAALSLPRHLGQHSGGMIICDNGLDSIVPLQPAAMPNRTIVQWDKDDCEDLGIVKVDLLGLGMLYRHRACQHAGQCDYAQHLKKVQGTAGNGWEKQLNDVGTYL